MVKKISDKLTGLKVNGAWIETTDERDDDCRVLIDDISAVVVGPCVNAQTKKTWELFIYFPGGPLFWDNMTKTAANKFRSTIMTAIHDSRNS